MNRECARFAHSIMLSSLSYARKRYTDSSTYMYMYRQGACSCSPYLLLPVVRVFKRAQKISELAKKDGYG